MRGRTYSSGTRHKIISLCQVFFNLSVGIGGLEDWRIEAKVVPSFVVVVVVVVKFGQKRVC